MGIFMGYASLREGTLGGFWLISHNISLVKTWHPSITHFPKSTPGRKCLSFQLLDGPLPSSVGHHGKSFVCFFCSEWKFGGCVFSVLV